MVTQLTECQEGRLYQKIEEATSIITEINRNQTKLETINLSRSTFEPPVLRAIFQEIKGCRRLKSLMLVGIFSTLPLEKMIEGLKIISELTPTSNLIYFDLSDNALSCKLPDEFRDFIRRLENVQTLKINNCGLGKIGGDWLAETLKEMKTKDVLNAIELNQNKFICFPDALGVTLKMFINLESIRIAYNTINEESLLLFLKHFEDHSLKVLDVRDNNLSVEACRLLGYCFTEWDVEELILGDCLMGTEGLIAFLENAIKKEKLPTLHGSLFKQSELQILDLSFNEIDETGIEELKKFVEKIEIGELKIQGNDFCNCDELISIMKSRNKKIVYEDEEVIIDKQNEEEKEIIEKLMNIMN